jgi:hypothetical protein
MGRCYPIEVPAPSVAKLTFVLLAIRPPTDTELISLSGLGICRATSPVYWINRGECLAETCFCCGAGSAAAF